jgi:hydroxyacylglutathione hydrolase
MYFRQIYDDKLAQYAYLIGCRQTGEAIVIDPERDIDRYTRLAEEENLRISAVAETHIHADFLSGAREFAEWHNVKLFLSDEGDADWKYEWAKDSRYDVTFLKDGDTFRVGNILIRAIHTPGHTPEHLCYLITDAGEGADSPMGLVSGDFVFVGDVGRPDLLESAAGHFGEMKPSARRLYQSVQQFQRLGEHLQVWPGHGAGSACGKTLGSIPETTVGYEIRFNPALVAAQKGEEAFVEYILTDQPEPPLYFARMKRLNKKGPPVLGALPQPRKLAPAELAGLAGRTDVTIVDTRPDRERFMEAHLKGSLHTPLDKNFPTVVGSYVEPDKPVYLIADAQDVEEAVRNLIRVGLDAVAGYATPDMLAAKEVQSVLTSTSLVDFQELEAHRRREDVAVLDVRRGDEYRQGHVPGAVHIPHVHLLARLNELPADKMLLVHCATGIRSAAATTLLERYGFAATLVNDDFEHWAAAHPQDLETESVPA